MKLYIARISNIIGEFGEQKVYEMLPTFRQEAADRCGNQMDRQRSLTAGILLCMSMIKEGVPIEDTPCFHKHGKIYFPAHEMFYVNLSHAGDYAACAVDTQEVGVDVEQVRPYRENVAKRIFLPEEIQTLSALENEEEKNLEFTRLWTMKESMAKLSGEGIAMLLSAAKTDRDHIYTQTYMPAADCFLSVSSHENHFPGDVMPVSPEFLRQLR